MPVRIRLQRHGKKGSPFYHIVVADGRAPRDGKFIEKVGTYNPMTHPAQIELDVDSSVQWLRNGAQPSDTVRSILSTKGVMLKHHLLKGVDKGALSLEQAEAKFQAWLQEKDVRISKLVQEKDSKKHEDKKSRFEAEVKLKDAKAAVVALKKSEALKAVVQAEASVEEAPAVEEAIVSEVPEVETPAVEETPAAEEAPVAE